MTYVQVLAIAFLSILSLLIVTLALISGLKSRKDTAEKLLFSLIAAFFISAAIVIPIIYFFASTEVKPDPISFQIVGQVLVDDGIVVVTKDDRGNIHCSYLSPPPTTPLNELHSEKQQEILMQSPTASLWIANP